MYTSFLYGVTDSFLHRFAVGWKKKRVVKGDQAKKKVLEREEAYAACRAKLN